MFGSNSLPVLMRTLKMGSIPALNENPQRRQPCLTSLLTKRFPVRPLVAAVQVKPPFIMSCRIASISSPAFEKDVNDTSGDGSKSLGRSKRPTRTSF